MIRRVPHLSDEISSSELPMFASSITIFSYGFLKVSIIFPRFLSMVFPWFSGSLCSFQAVTAESDVHARRAFLTAYRERMSSASQEPRGGDFKLILR